MQTSSICIHSHSILPLTLPPPSTPLPFTRPERFAPSLLPSAAMPQPGDNSEFEGGYCSTDYGSLGTDRCLVIAEGDNYE